MVMRPWHKVFSTSYWFTERITISELQPKHYQYIGSHPYQFYSESLCINHNLGVYLFWWHTMITLKNGLKVAVGSKNPVKLNAVRDAFEKLWFSDTEILWVDDADMRWIGHQPMTKEATAQWALNRATYCLQKHAECDLAFGLEWWVFFDEKKEKAYLFGVTCVVDRDWYTNTSFSWELLLPNILRDLLLSWDELWDAMDKTIHTQNIKQWQWVTWFLMWWVVDRQMWFVINIVQALIPRIHKDTWWY